MGSVKFSGDIAGGFGPNERFGLDIALVKIGKVVSTALNHEAEVGVKLKIQGGWVTPMAAVWGL
jgi:hypothetical protein